MKILIIDDDADIRSIARLSLSRVGGMEVIEASGGAEGVRKAQDEKPDVILLDMMMPTMDGMETLAALRSQPERPPALQLRQMRQAGDFQVRPSYLAG